MNQSGPTSNMVLRGNISVPLSVYLVFWGLAGLIFVSSMLIPGPFIFGDEAGYFNMAREFAFKDEMNGGQYNPLYPALISAFFHFGNAADVLLFTKALNATTYASIVFPLYIFASRLIKGNRKILLAAIMGALMPAGAYSYVIVAEAIYFPLVAWAFAALVLYQEKPNITRGIFLVLAITLSYFAKQAGFLLLPAMFIALVTDAIHMEKGTRKKLFKLHVMVLVLSFLGPVLWTLRNRIKNQGGGGVGYQEGWNRLAPKLHDWPAFLLDCLNNVFYSFSYLSVALYGALFVIFIWALIRWGERTRTERVTLVSLVLFLAGLMVLSAVFFTAYGMQDYPNGRYFDAVTPILLIFALAQLWNQGGGVAFKKQHVILGAVLIAVLVAVYSPLDVLFAYSFINNASFSFLHEIFMPYPGIIWAPYKGMPTERILVGVGAGAATLTLLLLPIRRNFIAIVLTFQVAVAVLAYANVILLGQQQSVANQMFRGLSSMGLLSWRDKPGRIVYDQKLESDQFMYFHRFWSGELPLYADVASMVHRYAFDFGVSDLPALRGMRKVPAPWRSEGVYDKSSERSGFLDIRNLEGVQCPPTQGRYATDRIVSASPIKFRIDLPIGRYELRLLANDGCPLPRPVNFDVMMSSTKGRLAVKVGVGAVHDIDWVEQVAATGLELEFVPQTGGLVMLDQLIVRRLDDPQIYGNPIFVSPAELPLPALMHNGNLWVYAVY